MTADPIRRLAPVVRLAPAKLNLTLAVLGRRTDGFHDLHSVMVPLALADRLSLAPLAGDRDRLHVEGADCGPADDNLVLRGVAAARAAVGGDLAADRAGWRSVAGPPPTPALAARLDKRIPVAAGLAGGSSDAAAALDGALEAWAAELAPAARLAVAAALGSDVPFFLAGGPAVVEGRGERVGPLPLPSGDGPGILLVTPVAPIATRAAFAAFAGGARPATLGASRSTSAHLADELRSGLSTADLLVRAGILASANDLAEAAAAVLPGLAELRRGLRRRLGRPVGVSGSGPTLWALYPSETAAELAAEAVRAAIGSGDLVAPGSAPPFVSATTFARPGRPAESANPGAEPADPGAELGSVDRIATATAIDRTRSDA